MRSVVRFPVGSFVVTLVDMQVDVIARGEIPGFLFTVASCGL